MPATPPAPRPGHKRIPHFAMGTTDSVVAGTDMVGRVSDVRYGCTQRRTVRTSISRTGLL
jgi:hypothetical protein